MQHSSCGIDFGTSNTSAGYTKDQITPTLTFLEETSKEIPSAIFFTSPKAEVFFGQKAIDQYIQGNEGRFMRSLKRILGTELMTSSTKINNKMIKFEDIIKHFLQNIKTKIDTQANTNIENVILGRPVHFRDNDLKGDNQAQKELKRIAHAIGYKNVEFQFEPIAAAFAHEAKLEQENLACVIDIGGGTSDFSIIRIGGELKNKQDRSDDILANTGIRIGGNDFDKGLSIKTFMPELGMHTTYGGKTAFNQELIVPTSQYFELSEWSSINFLYNYQTKNTITKILLQSNEPKKYQRLLEVIEKEAGHLLLNEVEKTKIKLSQNDKTQTTLSFLSDKPEIKTTINDFKEAISKDVYKIANSISECIKQANIKKEDISLIVLTGGSTEIPFVKEALCSMLPNATISQENKFSSVGLGLTYDAQRRFI